MVSRLVYLCGAGLIKARDRSVLLEDRLRRVPVQDEWEAGATPSRNALPVSLCADAVQRPAHASVTDVDDPGPLPTTVRVSGAERVLFPKPPPETAQHYSTLRSRAGYPVGGHSPFASEPQLLAETLREVSCGARTAPQDR